MLQAYFFRLYGTYIWKVPNKIRVFANSGLILLLRDMVDKSWKRQHHGQTIQGLS